MKRRMAMFVAVAAMAGVMTMFSPTSSATAAETNACAGAAGSAHLSSPFTYPVSGTPTGTGGTVRVLTGRTATFTFTFDPGLSACALGSTLGAGGTATGWCGLSTGFGTTTTGTGNSFSWVGVGSHLVVTGQVYGVVNAIPNTLSGDSCVTGADDFLINGAGAGKPCLVTSTSTVTGVSVSIITSQTVTGVNAHVGGGAHLSGRGHVCV